MSLTSAFSPSVAIFGDAAWNANAWRKQFVFVSLNLLIISACRRPNQEPKWTSTNDEGKKNDCRNSIVIRATDANRLSDTDMDDHFRCRFFIGSFSFVLQNKLLFDDIFACLCVHESSQFAHGQHFHLIWIDFRRNNFQFFGWGTVFEECWNSRNIQTFKIRLCTQIIKRNWRKMFAISVQK